MGRGDGQEPALGHPVEICKSLRFAVQMAQLSQVPWQLTQIVTLCCCPNWTRDLRRCSRQPRDGGASRPICLIGDAMRLIGIMAARLCFKVSMGFAVVGDGSPVSKETAPARGGLG